MGAVSVSLRDNVRAWVCLPISSVSAIFEVGDKDMLFAVARWMKDESGQDLIEYALVFALLALAAVASLRGVGTHIVAGLTSISNALNSGI